MHEYARGESLGTRLDWGSTENYIPTMQLCVRERERGGGGEGEGERDVSAVTELHVIHCIHPLHIYIQCRFFGVPMDILPVIKSSADTYGVIVR